jgi:ABC-2 type transport system ATP-binding protein
VDTIFIILIVAIVVIVALRILLRIYTSRRHTGRSDAIEEVPPPKVTPTVETVPPEARARVEEGENAVEMAHVYKSFARVEAVKDVSFTLAPGEVLGLVGPNGAGKTTTIRMLMDIIKADSGEIRVFGHPLEESTKNEIGYLPEERGLYRRMKVSDSMTYLAALKNVPSTVARKRAEELLRQVDMLPHRDKKVSELSRGMGQIIQFLVTILHDPMLVVLDEPFAGLDPVNRQLLKEIVLDLKGQGKAIILSTHMMNEVEEMSDRILMIDNGRVVLYGNLGEIKWRYRNNSVFVECEGDIGDVEGVVGRKDHGNYVELFLDGDTPPQRILDQLVARKVMVNRFEVSTPSLNEIFLQVVGRGDE